MILYRLINGNFFLFFTHIHTQTHTDRNGLKSNVPSFYANGLNNNNKSSQSSPVSIVSSTNNAHRPLIDFHNFFSSRSSYLVGK